MLKMFYIGNNYTFVNYANYSIPITTPDGYKPIYAWLYTVGFSGGVYCESITETTVNCWTITSSGTGSIVAKVLFVKDKFFA